MENRHISTVPSMFRSSHSINVARLTYLLVCEAAGTAIALSTKGTLFEMPIYIGILGGLGLALMVIGAEGLMKGFTLRGFSTATFGLAVGLVCAWLLTRVQISSIIELAFRDYFRQQDGENTRIMLDAIRLSIDVSLYASLGFLGAMLSLRGNRDDFAFIIPYVRFRQDASTGQPIMLDTEAVIDGRVLGILRSGFLKGRLIVPRFVLEDLQKMTESSTNSDRQRGQRGLLCLETMQKAPDLQISVHDTRPVEGNESQTSVLIETAKLLGARLMTIDENLTKVAKLQGLDTLNISDLDEALRPAIAVGQRIRLALVRSGKEDHQGVGYLPDGTMIVVNHGAPKIGSTADIIVVSTLQTSGGMIVFAEIYTPG